MSIHQIWKNSKYLFIGIIIVILSLNIFQFFIIKSKNKNIKYIESVYEKAFKILEDSKLENEKKYQESLNLLNTQIKDLQKIREEDSKKLQNQLNKIQSKYEKEYVRVDNTPIDSTIIISQQWLSREIDYSKFKRRY